MCVYMYTTNQWRVTRGTGKRAALWPGGHPLGKQQSCEGGWAPSQHCLVGDLSGPFGDGELRGGVHCEWTPWEWCGGCDEIRGRGAAGDEASVRRSKNRESLPRTLVRRSYVAAALVPRAASTCSTPTNDTPFVGGCHC